MRTEPEIQQRAAACSPVISVLLPVYNGESFLDKSIASILSQRFRNFELLIIDDASTDRSRDIIASFKDERIRAVLRSSNSGLFPALNELLGQVRAPLVQFFCQDDALAENCLETVVGFFGKHPEIGMCYYRGDVIDNKGKIIVRWRKWSDTEVVDQDAALQQLYYFGCLPGTLSAVAIRTEVLRAAGPFDTSFTVAGDYEMWVRACRQRPMGVIQSNLIEVRQHVNQLSLASSSGVEGIGENRRVLAMLLPLLPKAIQTRARMYVHMRQDVLSVHHCIRCAARGRISDCFQIIGRLGFRSCVLGLLFWFLTVDNRLWKPRPHFWVAGTSR
jgi:hypothetical protein